MSERYVCPVCGFPELDEPPYIDSRNGSFEICASCGFEFGVSDDDEDYTFESWRAEWIARGMPWNSVGRPQPAGWDPQAQLTTLLGPNGDV
jgi:hypothetical protein